MLRDHLGFVFQDFNLLETLSVYDNMVLPLVLARRPISEMKQKVEPIAQMLGRSIATAESVHDSRFIRFYKYLWEVSLFEY